MTTSFGALCSDFYVNTKLGVKLDLPSARETVMDFFQRVREAQPSMSRFKRYQGELALESPEQHGKNRWTAIRRTSVRTGVVNPDTLDDAYDLHELVLKLAPFYLSVSSLDIDCLEAVFGFDMEARGNHNALVHEAFYSGTPLGALLEDHESSSATDVQPFFGVSLDRDEDTQAFFEVKTRTGAQELKSGEWGDAPISVYLTLRRKGPLGEVKELPALFRKLTRRAEGLVESHVAPHLLAPLREAIASGA